MRRTFLLWLCLCPCSALAPGCDERRAAVPAPLESLPTAVTVSAPCGRTTAITIALRARPRPTPYRIRALEPRAVFALAGPSEGVTADTGPSTVDVHVRPPRGSVAGATTRGVLEVDVEGAVERYGLAVVPAGAQLTIAEPLIDFGPGPLGTRWSREIAITNRGTEPGIATIVGRDRAFEFPGQVSVPPGQTRSVPVTFTPRSAQPVAARVTVDALGACSAPHAIDLRGSGFGSGFSVDRAVVDFGETTCSGAAPAQTLLIRSERAQPAAWRARLARAGESPYVVDPMVGVIDGPGSARVSIRPRTVEPAVDLALDDELALETDEGTHWVSLRQRLAASALYVEGALTFGATPILQASPPSFVTVRNRGDLAADVSVAGASLSSGVLTVPPRASIQVPVTFQAGDLGAISDETPLLSTVPSCAPPATVRASALGVARATRMSATARAVCFLVNGGRVACRRGDATPGLEAFHLVGTLAGTDMVTLVGPPGVCVTTATGQHCEGIDQAGRYGALGALPFVVAESAPNIARSATGALWWLAATVVPTPIQVDARSLQDDPVNGEYVVVLGDGHVERWKLGPYGPSLVRMPWGGIGAVRAARLLGGDGCALLEDGRVACRNVVTTGDVPVPLAGASAVQAIAVGLDGDRSVCALGAGGAVRCWGSSRTGALVADHVRDLAFVQASGSYWFVLEDGRVLTLTPRQLAVGHSPEVHEVFQ